MNPVQRVMLFPVELCLYVTTAVVTLISLISWNIAPAPYIEHPSLPAAILVSADAAARYTAFAGLVWVILGIPGIAWHYHKELWRFAKQGVPAGEAIRIIIHWLWPYWLILPVVAIPSLLMSRWSVTMGELTFVIGMLLYVCVLKIIRYVRRFGTPQSFIRGSKISETNVVEEKAKALRAAKHQTNGEKQTTVAWAGLELPDQDSAPHFCVVGAPGSGKTLTLRLLMQGVLPNVGKRKDFRSLVYDPKQDMYPLLIGMGVDPTRIRILNPFDQRSVAWDIAADVQTEALADNVASILIPDNSHDANAFFAKAARSLLSGTMLVLHERAPGKWTLRDVLFLLSNIPLLKALLETSPFLKPISDSTLSDLDPRLAYNIQATVQNHLKLYRPLAALWHHAWKDGRKLSIAEWTAEDSILLLGNAEQLRTSIDAVNRVLFFLVSQYCLSDPTPYRQDRIWFFLDELKEAGRLDTLQRLITKGRSAGVRVVIGFQDMDGLASVYGRDAANELTGLCTNKAILRLDSLPTAQWASGHLGDAEVIITMGSRSYSDQGPSYSQSDQLQKREVALASELMAMPLADDGKYAGYFITPTVGKFFKTLDARPLLKPPATGAHAAAQMPRPASQQQLTPWDDADFARLNIRPDQPPSPFPVSPGPLPNGDYPRIQLPDM